MSAERFINPVFFLTIRTYGTWLHGDERGAVDPKHNIYGEPRLPHQPKLKEYEKRLTSNRPFIMDKAHQDCARAALQKLCLYKNWHLGTFAILPDHVHMVVSGEYKPERMMTQIKASLTRSLRERGLISDGVKVWARHGSTRYLWTEAAIRAASDYIIFGQEKHR